MLSRAPGREREETGGNETNLAHALGAPRYKMFIFCRRQKFPGDMQKLSGVIVKSASERDEGVNN